MKCRVSMSERVLAALAALVLLPLGIWIACAILLEDGGPVFFVQQRVGLKGALFPLFKFRSMKSPSSQLSQMQITVQGDPRITRIGHLLRQSKLDELPQLLNIIRGEMSWVGPRPELLCYVAHYSPQELKVLEYPPGLTDPASIVFRHESRLLARSKDPEKTYIEHFRPRKIRLNLMYGMHRNALRDCCVIVATAVSLLRS